MCFICNRLSSTIHEIVRKKNSVKSSWFMITVLSQIARFNFCIMCGDSCVHIISYISIGRNPGSWGPATTKAMVYPMYENVLRCLLTSNIFQRSVVVEQILKWHDIIPFSAPPSYGKRAFWNVSRLCATLYNYYVESRGGEKGSFHASKEWSEKFKKQMSVHSLKGAGDSASAERACGIRYIRR